MSTATNTVTAGKAPERKARRYGMVIDIDRRTGCGACMVACAAENNVPPLSEGADDRKGITLLRVFTLSGRVRPRRGIHSLIRKTWAKLDNLNSDRAGRAARFLAVLQRPSRYASRPYPVHRFPTRIAPGPGGPRSRRLRGKPNTGQDCGPR